MARIGFKKAKYNKIVGNTYAPLTDSKVPVFEKVVDEKFAPEFNSAELYANDGLAETDYSFKKGTLSLTVVDDEDKFVAELMGNTVAEDGAEVTSNIDDVSNVNDFLTYLLKKSFLENGEPSTVFMQF